jgi:hypothetical protein
MLKQRVVRNFGFSRWVKKLREPLLTKASSTAACLITTINLRIGSERSEYAGLRPSLRPILPSLQNVLKDCLEVLCDTPRRIV